MNKILVEIYIPNTFQSFDMRLPKKSKVYEVLFLLKQMIPELSGGRFMPQPETMLCYRDTGGIIDVNSTLEEARLQNGDCLMLL